MAMAVHRELGPGIDESFYHRHLGAKLRAAGIAHEFKPRRELVYRGIVADVFELDLVADSRVILELKALRGTFEPEHFTQILCYLKAWGLSTGLLLDFAKESLVFRRVVRTEPAVPPVPKLECPLAGQDKRLAQTLGRLLADILRDHGLGYRQTTYRGLLLAALRAEGLSYWSEPVARVLHLGQTPLRCVVVGGRCAVGLSALGDGLSAADRAVPQTCLRWLDLPWGLAAHFGKRTFEWRLVTKPQSPQIQDDRR